MRKRQLGQSTVELALVLPILIGFLGVIFQFATIFNVRMALSSAAREGARWASVRKPETRDWVKEYLANAVSQKMADEAIVEIEPDNFADKNANPAGTAVSVTVKYTVETVFPTPPSLFGSSGNVLFASRIPLSSTSIMRLEDVD